MKLDVVLRTHDGVNIHKDRDRYCGLSKHDLILKCVQSLINSLNNVPKELSDDIKIIVLDDHSSEELLNQLDYRFTYYSKHPFEIRNLPESGHHYSGEEQFRVCKDEGRELVYSVEDDYLHSPSALTEMLMDYELFSLKAGRQVCIYPFDMPDEYQPPWLQPQWVLHGLARHWKTTHWTTFTFLTDKKVFEENWETFKLCASKYGIDGIHEGNTICDIWKYKVTVFSPIPSLALHMQFDTQLDPYIDWKFWMENYTKCTAPTNEY